MTQRASLTLLRLRAFGLLAIALTSFASLQARDAGAAHVAFTQPLKIPPVLTGADIAIPMQEADVQILPGAPTRMWTYGGTFPGPTIRRPAGEQTRITFVNNLPAAAGSMTVHAHGEHATPANDGQPDDMPADPESCAQLLIPRGCEHTYTYDLTENGKPERPAMQWYHDHRMDVTGRNVWNGLAGMFIIDPPAGDHVEDTLPSGEYDVPIMIADRSFDAGNQLQYEFMFDGTFGDHVLMNGVPQPYFEVDTHRYRLRLLNASNARPYDVRFADGRSFQLIGTESGLLPAPQTRTHVRIGPAERVELVVDFSTDPLGWTVLLEDSLGFGAQRQLMQFRVTDPASDTSSVPPALRPHPDTWDDVPILTRTWVLNQIPNPDDPVWTINGRAFDHHRSDTAPLDPKLGSTERWVFVNTTAVDHLMHIHDVDWKIEARSGGVPPDADANLDVGMLKETFRVRPYEIVTVTATFTDHTGRYVFHCHILEHEDHSMMAQFEVAP